MNSPLDEREDYRVVLGDCIEHLVTLPDHCFDMSAYSPPFPAVYAYSSELCDIGNSEDHTEFKVHFGYLFRQLRRVIRPGRTMVVHCNQIVRMKRSGGEGVFDFRGMLIRLAERAGFIFQYDWTIRDNPQAQAIRTRSRELQFQGLEADRARSRGSMPGYLLKFVVPGENAVPVDSTGQVSRNEWIKFAESQWEAEKYPISADGRVKALTLNAEEARGTDDTRHICPLYLSIIDRLVRLYTNPGEIVLDPFTGIGSTGFVAARLGRRFYGCEIKPEYFNAAINNLERALQFRKESQVLLWDLVPTPADTQNTAGA